MPYFDDTLTLDEARQTYRRLARQLHPDVTGGDDAAFKALGTEYELFKLRKERPAIAVAAPAPNADPMAWFAAIKQAAVAAAQATPEERTRVAAQARAYATAPTSTPPPPPTAAPAATATAPRSRRPRSGLASPAQPRQSTAQRIAQKEADDYRAARFEPKDKYGHRRHGDVVIFWEDSTWDTIECVAILTASNPRHEIRRNGSVVYSEPATRRWQLERRAVIERARRMV